MELDRLLEVLRLIGSGEFLTGFALGLISATVAVLLGMATRSRTAPISAGLAASVAAVWLFVIGRAPTGVAVAVLLLAIVGGSGWLESGVWRRGVGSVLGSAVLALGAQGSLGFRLVLFLVVAAAVFLVSAAEASLGPRMPTAILFAFPMLALVVGIPEVNRALILAGSMLPAALLPIGRRRLGRAGAFAYPALFAWVTLADGATARGAVIGVLASLGILGLGYLAPRFADRIGSTEWLVVGQMAWAMFASRVAGVRRGVADALMILSVGAAVVWWLSTLRERARSEVATFEMSGPDR